jgi:hypothetical protein
VHGEQPGAGRACISFYLTPQERRHSPPADIVQVFHEAVIVGPDIALLDQQQARAGELVALVAEIDLLLGELATQAFFMDATPSPMFFLMFRSRSIRFKCHNERPDTKAQVSGSDLYLFLAVAVQ